MGTVCNITNDTIYIENLLNKRIQFEDQLATVRYVGEVPPTKGEWLGVEWDHVSRGKHDGFHEGVRYFICSVPNSGSFIRYSSKINIGRSFVEAVIVKYIGENVVTLQENEEKSYDAQKDLDVLHWAGTKLEVEALGWEKIRRKQRQLDRLNEVGLSFEQISHAGKPEEIEATCPNIVDLNLSKNLLSDWETVAKICEQLKKLEVLRLNYNRFQILEYSPIFPDAFKNLKNLSLNYTRISWKQIELLEQNFSVLENLQLGFNNIRLSEEFDESNKENFKKLNKIKGFVKLKIINLESNIISSWNEIERFSDLPSLEILFVNNNAIDQIYYNEDDFPKLRHLNISDNKIGDWNSVNELNKFPSLQELRIKKNTFLSRDRIDAERFYLKLCITDMKLTEEIEKNHPRFKELCEIHGTPIADDISQKSSSSILKDRLLALTISYRTGLKDDPIKKLSKKLLGTMEIRNLKNLIQKLFGIPSSQQKLYAVTSFQEEQGTTILKLEMDDDLRQLSYYDLLSGDEIIVLAIS
ncbi:14465_t:CDS:10 [Funneliformis geosporum]|uniref:33_t:CDS:1 n=1 Tax=Funneliformis geosporum TaxID=1117311 RepID=A0A9W4SF21_9GLOM|nr:33_t:CDS:10 [Funneliformis geosporum]CAI2167294.1 14465_t:CDS:10 [Funneliformis geosporum]